MAFLFLSKRRWLRQELPITVTDFGPTASRRHEPHPALAVRHWDVSRAVAEFVQKFDDSLRDQIILDVGALDYIGFGDASEATAAYNFRYIINRVCAFLGHSTARVEANAWSSRDPGKNAKALASSSVQKADYGLSLDGRRFLVVEMKRPSVFRRSVNSTIPNLCESALAASSSSPRTEDVVLVEPVYQLYRYMKSMKLGYGIISSFDLTFLVSVLRMRIMGKPIDFRRHTQHQCQFRRRTCLHGGYSD